MSTPFTFDLSPRLPKRPLFWSDFVLDLQDSLLGATQPIYIVGGAVRDAFLHRPVHDLDLATPRNAYSLAKRIANAAHGDVYLLDAERDVARVIINTPNAKIVIDVAAFRGEDLLADLSDRDFTMNAMAVDLNGDLNLLIDPLGGEADLLLKQVRRCSPASLAKDVVRGLRAVRQSLQLGFRIERQTLEDIRQNVVRLRETSIERIRDEFFKVLDLPKPAGALRVLDKLGLLAQILPETTVLHTTRWHDDSQADYWEHTLLMIEKLTALLSTLSYQRTDNTAATFDMGMIVMRFDRYRAQLNTHLSKLWANDRPHRALMMLAALLHDVGAADTQPQEEIISASAALADQRVEALHLSNAERQRILTMIRHQQHPFLFAPTTPTPLSVHRYWYALKEGGLDVILFAMASYLGTQGIQLAQDDWIRVVENAGTLCDAYYQQYDTVVMPPLLLDGNQLKQHLNLKPSPMIGELLTLIREGQAEGRITTIAEALAAAQKYLDMR